MLSHLAQIEFSLCGSRINCTPSINGITSAELTSSNRIKLLRLKQDHNISIDPESSKHLLNILFDLCANTSHESAGVAANKPLIFKIKIKTNANFCKFKLEICILNWKIAAGVPPLGSIEFVSMKRMNRLTNVFKAETVD